MFEIMEKKILVLGSNGKTGKRVSERLKNKNIPISLGSRNGTPSFDWNNTTNWNEVLEGIESVYITFQPDLAVPQAFEKIKLFSQTAKLANVKKLVLLSGRGEKEAQSCEQVIVESGLEWTVIRASWFMQNFSENFLLDSILNNELVLPIINATEPFVDADDIADVAVACLIDSDHNSKIYELTGPELLSFEKATKIISSKLNRAISYSEIPMENYKDALKSFQLPEDFIWLINYLFTEVLDGRNEYLSEDISLVLGRKPTTFDEYVIKTIKTGVWEVL